jgi:hypothetical protein
MVADIFKVQLLPVGPLFKMPVSSAELSELREWEGG